MVYSYIRNKVNQLINHGLFICAQPYLLLMPDSSGPVTAAAVATQPEPPLQRDPQHSCEVRVSAAPPAGDPRFRLAALRRHSSSGGGGGPLGASCLQLLRGCWLVLRRLLLPLQVHQKPDHERRRGDGVVAHARRRGFNGTAEQPVDYIHVNRRF